ncbi:MAG: flagellar type III secretion system pore protein FliP [Deltaproteobacteria bacterium]|nr:flagellar type III secretion system pore protein FliP [Candidatus Anaeroferrophillus wilburensis]MBN2889587.1 flagellar type III secretion system pore protein FliP [Deltaproteobacteria bacterium]
MAPAAAAEEMVMPALQVGLSGSSDPQQISVAMQILLLLTVLTLAPAILVLMTSFTRLVVVFHFLRQALGTQQMPPNQVLVGLSLFLTFFIMFPVFQQINVQAVQPYLAKEINQQDAYEKAMAPVRQFMFHETREQDLAMFISMAKLEQPRNVSDIPTYVIIPAFVISELKTAFQIGFLIYIPFLILDMVVASVLLSMGMMMLPPIMISLPFKLILFVLADGWHMMVGSLMKSF